jgi:integrase/recombinase XerD
VPRRASSPTRREERGLRPSSIKQYHYALRRLEAYLTTRGGVELGALSPPLLSGFITETAPTVGRSLMVGMCVALRIWLRYLHREGVLARDLSRILEVPQRYRLADVPRAITWDAVRRMLEVVDQRTPVGRRDYAILLLLVTYGLRGREIAALTLDDLDWKRERLLVPERKADHTTAYPLSAVVGDALARYLRDGRPATPDRHIFLRHLAPRGPLTSAAISGRASHYLHRAGIPVARAGSHTLRHLRAAARRRRLPAHDDWELRRPSLAVVHRDLRQNRCGDPPRGGARRRGGPRMTRSLLLTTAIADFVAHKRALARK